MRINTIDLLRGAALVGVIAEHFFIQAGNFPVLEAVFHQKSYRLFALLFGWGFVLMGTDNGRWLRRMMILWIIGAAHGSWVNLGDILALYAAHGCLLIFTRRWSHAALVMSAIVLNLVGALFIAWGGVPPEDVTATPVLWINLYSSQVILQVPMIMGMMLFGVWFGRINLQSQSKIIYERLAAFILVGVVCEVLSANALDFRSGAALAALGAPFMVVAYVGLAFRFAPRFEALTALGRFTLSAYLIQSFVLLITGPSPLVGAVLIVALMAAALWYPFQRGPVETVWRELSEARIWVKVR